MTTHKFRQIMRIKRIAVFFIALVCMSVFAGTFIPQAEAIETAKNEKAYTYFIWDDFEYSKSQSPFNDNIINTSASYIWADSKMRTADWLDMSDKMALEIKTCDVRWWNITASPEELLVSFEFKSLTDDYQNEFEYCLSTQDEVTNTGGNGGLVLKISRDASTGKPAVKSKNNTVLTVLENKQVYHIFMSFKRGQNTFNLYVEDKLYGDLPMAAPYYLFNGQRITVSSRNKDSSFAIDNFGVYTQCKYPQSHSSQELLKDFKVKLPEYKEQSKTKVFFNDTEIKLSGDVINENETYYVPAKDLAAVLGGNISEKGDDFTFEAESIKITGKTGSNSARVNDNEITADNAPVKKGKLLYLPLNFINEALGVKVWYDKEGDMIVISNKEYASDDILRLLNSRFYMNGQPYYELSFNKFDLVYQTAPDYFGFDSSYPNVNFTFKAAENAIKALSENGFRSIRFFCICGGDNVLFDPETKETYYKIMDQVFDLLDKYNMQANVDLCLISNQFLAHEYVEGTGWVVKTESTTDLVADPECESRKVLYDYIEEFVGRYKDRHSVLMWEIQNEGALGADIGQGRTPAYSLLQLGNFYEDVTKKIKSVDSKHLVSSGDACLRPSQYNLFLATIEGRGVDWSTDSAKQRMDALWLLNHGVDVVSCHTYSWGAPESGSSCIDDETGKEFQMDYVYLLNEVKKLGKGLYCGEFSGTVPFNNTMSIRKPEIAELQTAYLNSVIEQGVQLGHWWTFESNRQGFGDDDTWNCSLSKHRFTFDAVAEANRKIKEKYVVNGAEKANTAPATSLLEVSKDYNPNSREGKNPIVYFAIGAAVLAVLAAAVIVTVKTVKNNKK